MNCKHFKIRQKKYKRIFFCEKLNKEIEYENCFCCEVKQYKPVKRINPVSKKRVSVSKETYNKVFTRDNGICQICGSKIALEAHHIEYRSENKSRIDDETNLIMLCNVCHRMVHSDKHKWQPILKEKVRGEVI